MVVGKGKTGKKICPKKGCVGRLQPSVLLSAVLELGKINVVMVKVSLQQQQKCLTSEFLFLPIVTLELKTIYAKG